MLAVRAAADDHQRGAVDPAPDVGQRLDEHVLALARDQPRYADHGRPLPEAVAGAQFLAGRGVGAEAVDVDAGRQMLQVRSRPERGGEPAAGVVADEGHDVGGVADPPQRRARDRKHRPAHLVAVRAGQHPPGAGLAGAAGQQRQRRGGPEPHGLDVVLGDERPHPALHPGFGQHQRAGMAHDAVGRGAVVVLAALPARRVHRHPVLAGRGEMADELLEVGLDAAGARRKVIGDQQDPRHRPTRYLLSQCAQRTRRSVQVRVERAPHRGVEVRVVRTGGRDVELAQRIDTVGVGDEPGEPPGPVIAHGPLRACGVQFGVGRQRGVARGAGGQCGRRPGDEIGDALDEPARRVRGGVGAGGEVKELVGEHDSQRRVAHGRRARGEHDPLPGGAVVLEVDVVGDRDGGDVGPLPVRVEPGLRDELRVGVGGDHHDVAVPVGAPELLDGAHRVTDVTADPGEQAVGARTAQADQVNRAAVADDERSRHRRRRGAGRRRRIRWWGGDQQDGRRDELGDEDDREYSRGAAVRRSISSDECCRSALR